MAVITTTNLTSFLDHLAQFYLRAIGATSTVYGIGANGTQVAAANLLTDFNALDDINAANFTIAGVLSAQNSPINSFVLGQLQAVSSGILRDIQTYNPSTLTLDAYLLSLNTGGTPNQLLLNPAWLALYPILYGSATPSPANLFFEVLQGSTYANGLGSLVYGGSFTAGYTIPSTYAGGFPEVLVSGLAGSGVVTVTGTAFNPATQTTSTGVTWTATVSANGTVSLAPGTAPANSLIQAVSAISLAPGITGGTFYVQAARPTGRPLLP